MTIRISKKDLSVERIKRSGPGGQHRNKRETGIRLTHLPTGLVAMATTERSQAQNLEKALQSLKRRLEKKYAKKKKRKATRPTKASKERRLKDKRKRSEKKERRQKLDPK